MSHAGNVNDLLAAIIEVLARIAPEALDAPLDPNRPLREQIEMDSMDHVHFAIELKDRFGVDIPERDYRAMRGLGDLQTFIAARLQSSGN